MLQLSPISAWSWSLNCIRVHMGATWFSVDATVLLQRHPGEMYPIPIPNSSVIWALIRTLLKESLSHRKNCQTWLSHYTFLLTFHFLSFVFLPVVIDETNKKSTERGLLTSTASFSILWTFILSTASWKLLSRQNAPSLQRKENK